MLPTIFLQHNNNKQLLSTTQNQVACDHETYGRDIIMGVVEKVVSFSQSVKFLKHMKKKAERFYILFLLIRVYLIVQELSTMILHKIN